MTGVINTPSLFLYPHNFGLGPTIAFLSRHVNINIRHRTAEAGSCREHAQLSQPPLLLPHRSLFLSLLFDSSFHISSGSSLFHCSLRFLVFIKQIMFGYYFIILKKYITDIQIRLGLKTELKRTEKIEVI
jgi:hypothetical protein